MRTLLIILLAMSLMSCKVHIATNFKIVTKERSYYTDKVTYINDSVMFYEKYRNGLPKAPYIVPYRGTEIIPSN
jgi:hypothetical protein